MSAIALYGALAGGCYHGLDGERDTVGGGDGNADGGTDGELQCAEDGPAVGTTPLRRLTREQYDNTIRDLLGIDSHPADTFLPDERVGAFHSNAVAPITELAVEQYMDAAEALATEAVANLDALLACDPAAGEPCASQFISEFGQRAYRRPLTATEQQRYEAVWDFGNEREGFALGTRLVIQATLQSPYFLYHVEFGLPDADAPGADIVALDPHELASRLSYFLWNTMPDDELLAAAADLDDPDALRAQAQRMIEDPRARDAIASFHQQWLGLSELEYADKDTGLYPAWDEDMKQAIRGEMASFADYVIRRGDGSLTTLLTAPYAFPQGALFDIYGLTPPAGYDGSEPIELDPNQRAGLLTQVGVMATHAHANQSSPIKRGVMVRQNLLCQPLPPPPPDVDNAPPSPDPDATTRERFEEHTQNPECAGCHSLIDGIGLGLENYDAIGAYRTIENGLPVDASGSVVGSDDMDGEFDGGVGLAAKLADSEQVRECVATQWFRFAFGRMEQEDDGCSVASMTDAFAASDYDIRELLVAIVTTDAFRYRRATPAESGVAEEVVR